MSDLNEMWQELEQYQPYARRHGFGDVWRRMTTERTVDAACFAAYAVAWSAHVLAHIPAAQMAKSAAFLAATALEATAQEKDAAEWSRQAIEKIRKAIELENK